MNTTRQVTDRSDTEMDQEIFPSHFSTQVLSFNYWLLAVGPWLLIFVVAESAGSPIPILLFGLPCAAIGALGIWLRLATRVARRVEIDEANQSIEFVVAREALSFQSSSLRPKVSVVRYPGSAVSMLTFHVSEPCGWSSPRRIVYVGENARIEKMISLLGFTTA